MRGAVVIAVAACAVAFSAPSARAHPAIDAFTAYCFKAGQTAAQARTNMQGIAGDPLPFTLTFWDKTLEPAPVAPAHAERRCEVRFDGDHADAAVAQVQAKMAMPPVFGTSIPLTPPYAAVDGTAYLDARELLRGRVAVVHIKTASDQTVITVDRLPAGKGLQP